MTDHVYKAGDRVVVTRHDESGDPPVGWIGTVTEVDRSRVPLRVDWHPPGWSTPGWWLTMDQVKPWNGQRAATQEELALTHSKAHLMGSVQS
jgi:hypothetical protein